MSMLLVIVMRTETYRVTRARVLTELIFAFRKKFENDSRGK